MTLLEYLKDNLGMSIVEIQKFARTSPHRYKKYQINKRNSDQKRTIAHPSKELKFVQRLLIKYLERKLPVHHSSHGYIKKKSIKTNAQAHLGNEFLLKMDFSNFFPSITPDLLYEKFNAIGIEFSQEDFEILEGLLFCRFDRSDVLRLSIGAPSSPLLSNFILNEFDNLVSKYCSDNGISYSRYADDLTFSTNIEDLLFIVPKKVEDLISRSSKGRIIVNADKTIFSSKAHNRHVTGITLTNDGKLSIGRNRKRLVSAMIHKFVLDELSSEDVQKLQGYFSFAVHIEPEFYDRMISKYGHENVLRLTKYQINL